MRTVLTNVVGIVNAYGRSSFHIAMNAGMTTNLSYRATLSARTNMTHGFATSSRAERTAGGTRSTDEKVGIRIACYHSLLARPAGWLVAQSVGWSWGLACGQAIVISGGGVKRTRVLDTKRNSIELLPPED